METLGEDILLLAIKPDGKQITIYLRYALAGSELVRLAVRRRVDVVKDRITVLDPTPTGDRELDEALRSIMGHKRPPLAKSWVGSPRGRIVEAYQARLEAAGVIRADRRPGFLGFGTITRWTVLDPARTPAIRARLDAIAHSAGPVGSDQAALGGLVYAIGLHTVLYPGRPGKPARDRLEAVAKKDRTARLVRSAVDSAIQASAESAVSASVGSSLDAAMSAATDAAIQASIDASVQASIDAAIAASVDAAVSASVDAAVSASIDAAVSASVDAATSHSSHDSGGSHHHHS